MLRPTAVKVKLDKDYCIVAWFDNGEIKKFDVKPYIKGSWYDLSFNCPYFYICLFTKVYKRKQFQEIFYWLFVGCF